MGKIRTTRNSKRTQQSVNNFIHHLIYCYSFFMLKNFFMQIINDFEKSNNSNNKAKKQKFVLDIENLEGSPSISEAASPNLSNTILLNEDFESQASVEENTNSNTNFFHLQSIN